jgi:capsular exopolysaccharide synthesis family protein
MSRVFDALNLNAGRNDDPLSTLWEQPPSVLHKTRDEDAEQLTEQIVAAPLNEVPLLNFEARTNNRLVLLDESNLAAENIRILTSRLKYMRRQHPFRQLLVSSSVNGEGKSTIAANLAITLATREGERTLLIDGDILQAKLTRIFQATAHPGLVQWLATREPLSSFVRKLPEAPLFFLPVGQRDKDYCLRAEGIVEAIATVDDSFDWIIVDAPPLTFLADSSAWAQALERCLLVVRSGVTPKKMLQKALDSLPSEKLVGLVLNESSDTSHSYYSRYYSRKSAKDSKSSCAAI